jgi:methyltransferase family protein
VSVALKTVAFVGNALRRTGGRIESWTERAASRSAAVFETPDALHINRARLDHLASLGLDIDGKRVIEVGAGIGLLGEFFERRGCRLLATEGRADNLAEIARRFPSREIRQVDLDRDHDLTALGRFDFAFCYGTLYHLAKPREALAALAGVADTLLLETCLTPGRHTDVHLVREGPSHNQAIAGVGCRPTRPWIMETLRALWGHAYTTTDQPDHPDFETDWLVPYKHGNHRAVFVASRTPIARPKLTEVLPDRQPRHSAI